MPRILIVLLGLLWPMVASGTEDFALLGKAVDAVIRHHFAAYSPSYLFSIAKGFDSSNRKYEPIDPALERELVARLGEGAKFYVSLEDLRFPEVGERDPKVPGGERPRGIESAQTGESVSVFYISGIDYVDAHTLNIRWSRYDAPGAAQGGSYVVHITRKGFEIKEGGISWVT